MPNAPLATRPPWLPAAIMALGRHQFLTARQLAAVVQVPEPDVAVAMDGLAGERLVVRLRPTMTLTGPEPPPAYAVTRHSAALAAEANDGRVPHVPNPKKSLYMLAHELARNDLGVVLERLHATGRLRLLRWETSREKIACSVTLRERGRLSRVPLVADALVVVEFEGTPTTLLVEIDRGTVSVPRMRTKYAGYHAWWREDGPMRRFGTKSLRVLTLAPTANRVERLCDAAIDATDGHTAGLFWFGEQAVADVEKPERLRGAAFTIAKRGDATTRALFLGDTERAKR